MYLLAVLILDLMDIIALLLALLEFGNLFGGRVTVSDRYEMKRRVRELRQREKRQKQMHQRE